MSTIFIGNYKGFRRTLNPLMMMAIGGNLNMGTARGRQYRTRTGAVLL